jgi:small subunit ribosomal protein S5e
MADVEEEAIVDTPEEIEDYEEEAVVEEEEEFVQISGGAEIKLFGKWKFDDIEVRDISLVVRDASHKAESFVWKPGLRRSV